MRDALLSTLAGLTLVTLALVGAIGMDGDRSLNIVWFVMGYFGSQFLWLGVASILSLHFDAEARVRTYRETRAHARKMRDANWGL